MNDVKSIEQAIQALPRTALAEFRRWFTEFDSAAWDHQIEVDAGEGKLDGLGNEALTEYRAGKVRGL